MSDLPRHIANTQILTNGDMSADVTSSPLNTNETGMAAIQAVWSGSSPLGTLYLQGSTNGTTFTNLDAGKAVSGNTGSHIWNLDRPGYSHIQVFYDVTSGTGTLTIIVNLKR